MGEGQRQSAPDLVSFCAGCFIHGLYLEGAGWDHSKACLVRQKPKQLVHNLPVLKVIPIESHRLKLQVRARVLRF